MKKKTNKHNRGFTLVEGLLSAAIFTVLALTICGMVSNILKGIGSYRKNITTSALADQYVEILRNMPYSQIGTLSGNPHGSLPDFPNAIQITNENIVYKIYYVVNYIDDPADGTISAGTDPAPNDYKQVKMYILNTATNQTSSFLTNFSPKSLEGLNNGGALSIQVINSVGAPVPNATVHITNASSTLNLTRTTNANGYWIEVGLPDMVNGYHVVVTKDGYSADQTYPLTVSNPNPIKPDSTISNGQVTQVSFSIDKLSSLTLYTLDQYCSPLTGVGMEVRGTKLIGSPPIIFKFDNLYTSNSNGNIPLQNIEWDNYNPALTGSSYTIRGSSPIQQINILPNTDQIFTFILGPKTNDNLLIIVKDAITNNPVEGAKVELSSDTTGFDDYKFTGGSVWNQNSWLGGPNQSNWIDSTKYYEGSNISANQIPQALRLASYDEGATYSPSGYLISSTFDTGTASSTFTNFNWQPASQNSTTSVKFQIATSNDSTTWNFTGPDGTSGTYYTVPGTTINSSPARYIRYKVFLDTSDTSISPVITGVNINYVSGCFTPGQVIFTDLQSADDYQVKVTKDGYVDQTVSGLHATTTNPDLQILL